MQCQRACHGFRGVAVMAWLKSLRSVLGAGHVSARQAEYNAPPSRLWKNVTLDSMRIQLPGLNRSVLFCPELFHVRLDPVHRLLELYQAGRETAAGEAFPGFPKGASRYHGDLHLSQKT